MIIYNSPNDKFIRCYAILYGKVQLKNEYIYLVEGQNATNIEYLVNVLGLNLEWIDPKYEQLKTEKSLYRNYTWLKSAEVDIIQDEGNNIDYINFLEKE
jgi:hypothetical protein